MTTESQSQTSLHNAPGHLPFPMMPSNGSSSSSSNSSRSSSSGSGSGGGSSDSNHSNNNNHNQHPGDNNGGSGSTNASTGQHQRSHLSGARRQNDDRQQRLVKRYRVEVAASMSSVLSTATAFPLDSVKTRMQTYKYSGFLDCVRHTYRAESLRGFFRGVTAPMASVTLVRTVSFSIYQRAKHAYSGWLKQNFGVDVIGHVSTRGSYPNLWSFATFGAAGATAGSCITLIACPFELTKLSAQVSVLLADKKNCHGPKSHAIAASYQNKGTLKTLGNLVKHRGITGLYTGFRLHLLRDTLGTGLYFMTYESSKQLLTRFGGDGAHSNPLAVLVAGGMCGIVSWALIYPIDSAKSVYQRNSLLYTKGQKVEPVKIQFFHRHMYRGLGVSMGRSCVVNSIFFSSFEFIKKRIKAMED